LVEEDINETTYTGVRVSARFDYNDDWNFTVSHATQDVDSDGVFFADPTLGDDDLKIQRYSDDRIEDTFHNTNWTIEGRIGELQLIYTGAFTERETDQVVDYADYMFVGQYLPYYICDGSVSYPGAGGPAGTCQAPVLFVDSKTDTEVSTHEFRVSTDQTRRLRSTFGAFYSDLELKELNDFTYPGSTLIDGYGVQTGFSPNFAFQNGYSSSAEAFPSGVIFRNDVKRTDEQYGVFGELYFDINEQLSLTLGVRYYDIEVDFDGSANSSFCNLFQPDANAYGTDISDLYNGDGQITYRNSCDTSTHITYTADTVDETTPAIVVGGLAAPNTAQTDGYIGKASLSWTPNDNALMYFTWSEGFRPGLLNRPGGRTNGAGTYTVPFALDTDDVTNLELGWKADLLDYTLRFNGSIFFIDVENLQTTIFDPSIVNLFFSDNAADAEVKGIEGNFIWAPPSVEGLTINGAFSMLDTEITNVITPTDDVRRGDELAFAPGFQANLRARYEWGVMNGMTAHIMPHMTYSDNSYSDIITINRDKIDSWVMFGVTAGVSADQWTAELFIDNLTDERAELSRNFVFDVERVTYSRPLTAGFRVSYDF
jgi:iron complex outermembrane recepter protein